MPPVCNGQWCAKLIHAVSELTLEVVRAIANSIVCSAKFGFVPIGVFDKRAVSIPVPSGHGEKN